MKTKFFICLYLSFILFLVGCSEEKVGENKVILNKEELVTVDEKIYNIEEVKDVIHSSYILHAGGVTPDGIVGSNSLEAIDNSYKKGYRMLEIDFCWTEDKQLVCVHDWDSYYTKRLGKECITLQEFEEHRYGTYGFTSLTLDHLCEWLKEHRDVIIVTDIKENCVDGAKIIAMKYPKLIDNFCIQMYDKSEYTELYSLGFTKIIWTLYKLSWDEKKNTDDIVNFALVHDLVGITFSAELVDLIPNYIEDLKLAKTSLYVHTVNDYNSQCKYFNMGITGIYTDIGKVNEVIE